MSEDLLKKLTGKNKNDYEPVAKHLVNDCDEKLFQLLVEKEDFLFDFVKQNVSKRIEEVINENNYCSLISFMKYYSPSYEDLIAKNLAKFADEDLTDEMLEKFENGTDDEKCYCARFFSYIQDPLALPFLRFNAQSENENLSLVCASSLGILKDEESYNFALEKLKDEDEFEKLKAVKFLTAYGNKDALMPITEMMITSSMQENIACEIPYLVSLPELLNTYEQLGLLVLNNIINGLGEIIPLSTVFDYELYDVFENIISSPSNSVSAVVLLNAAEKFETLTENEEYIFDEDKNTQNEIKDIRKLLSRINKKEFLKLSNNEVRENSLFVYTALDFCTDEMVIRELLRSNNQTLILRALEVLKKIGALDDNAKTIGLLKVTDLNIKTIIRAL